VKGYAEDVIALVHELDLKNVILIGHSLAGDINLVAATSSPKDFIGFIAIDFFKNAATALPDEFQSQVVTILDNLKKDFAQTNEQYARMALLTSQTPDPIAERVVKDYRDAYRPMGMEIMPEIFEIYKKEKELLPLLSFKLYLINVDYMPTNEEALKKYPGKGYKLLHMKGTSHYPMLEDSATLNKLLQQMITDIEKR
jgi:pimeloyl-ACP methyl ester carboxylesterase